MNYSLVFLFSLSISIAWYVIYLFIVIKKRGLDPSLITYLTPLRIANHWTARALIAFVLLLEVLNSSLGSVLAMCVLMLALIHTILILLFGRSATQPLGYYMGIATIGLLSLLHDNQFILLIVLVAAVQEIYLYYWIKTRKKRYQKWIKNKAKRIHYQYEKSVQDLTKQQWFYVLHLATTEDIARPKIVRHMEIFYYYLMRPTAISTGIMQVKSAYPMTDEQSVKQGTEIIINHLRHMPKYLPNKKEELKWLAKAYNGSTSYSKYLIATYPGINAAWAEINKPL